ncbi:MAG: hypothetical protein MI807_18605 [Verrucomicrobiales bacterium]|nr:hypothetical protein [Verrucomicrobiales bacterium]
MKACLSITIVVSVIVMAGVCSPHVSYPVWKGSPREIFEQARHEFAGENAFILRKRSSYPVTNDNLEGNLWAVIEMQISDEEGSYSENSFRRNLETLRLGLTPTDFSIERSRKWLRSTAEELEAIFRPAENVPEDEIVEFRDPFTGEFIERKRSVLIREKRVARYEFFIEWLFLVVSEGGTEKDVFLYEPFKQLEFLKSEAEYFQSELRKQAR